MLFAELACFAHSADSFRFEGRESEYDSLRGLDIPSMRTPGAPPRSTRENNIDRRFVYNDYMAYHYAFLMKVATVRELETYSEVAKDPRWVEAMNEDMQELSKNETWELVLSSRHQKAIGCQWIYKVKHNVDGTVNRYKALLVAKGYAPTHRVEYEETFALVEKMTTIRTVIELPETKG